MTFTPQDPTVCPGCGRPGTQVEGRPQIYECLNCDYPGVWEAAAETDPGTCSDCQVPGVRLEGFPYPETIYECPDCEDVWHVVAGRQQMGFPEPENEDDLEALILDFDRVYPPVEPEQLAALLPFSARLVVGRDLDLDEWDGLVHHPTFTDPGGRFLDIAWRPYKALTDAARQRFGHTPTRFSLVARALALESRVRNGTLAPWVIRDRDDGPPRVHPAVLEAFARTPAHQLEDATLVERIRQVACGQSGKEVAS